MSKFKFFFFKSFRLIEKQSSWFQGKGYGATTINHEINLVHKFLVNKPSLAIDIGGNIGDYTAGLRIRNPNLEIHTFEPSSRNIKILKERFFSDPLVKVIPLAVSNISGEATLFSNAPGSGLSSLTKRRLDHFNINFDTTEIVQTICFEDYWLNELNSKELDLVKIDIEGHELSALKGFGKTIRSVKVLQFEFGGCNIDTRTYFQDFWYYFKEHNFDIFRITPLGAEKIPRYLESDEFFGTTNYIAVRRK